MDSGRGDGDFPGNIIYSSEVINAQSETIQRFYERVNTWAAGESIRLGEGHMTVLPPTRLCAHYVLYLTAPVVEGDWDVVRSMFQPVEETCVDTMSWEDENGKRWTIA